MTKSWARFSGKKIAFLTTRYLDTWVGMCLHSFPIVAMAIIQLVSLFPQVISKALSVWNLSMVPLSSPEMKLARETPM